MTKANPSPGDDARPADSSCPPPPPPKADSGKGRGNGKWRKKFLEALIATSNVKLSAEIAGADVNKVYKARQKFPAFAAEWRKAIAQGYHNLELEVLAHLRAPDPKVSFDIANALRLLAHHRAAAASQLAEDCDQPEDEALASIEAALDAMRVRAAALRAAGNVDDDDVDLG